MSSTKRRFLAATDHTEKLYGLIFDIFLTIHQSTIENRTTFVKTSVVKAINNPHLGPLIAI